MAEVVLLTFSHFRVSSLSWPLPPSLPLFLFLSPLSLSLTFLSLSFFLPSPTPQLTEGAIANIFTGRVEILSSALPQADGNQMCSEHLTEELSQSKTSPRAPPLSGPCLLIPAVLFWFYS